MRNRLGPVLVATALLTGLAGPGGAAQITSLYSTGVDGSGNLLANGAVDSHYSVSAGSVAGTSFAIDNATRPGSWVPNTATSQWISPATNTLGGPGPFTYSTTFDLTGFDETTAQITFDLAADNQSTIFLGSTQVGVRAFGGWTSFQTFSITSGFTAGINTLSFVVPNNQQTANDGPTGLHVRIVSASADAAGVPEPSTLMLGSLALLAAAAGSRRRFTG